MYDHLDEMIHNPKDVQRIADLERQLEAKNEEIAELKDRIWLLEVEYMGRKEPREVKDDKEILS